ncbi:hypothetical protein FHS39_001279 [Streptomyces olivoverticillatus]|uniref:Lipoprotein n=1 Tax=Streptomyces olivoverticillatus TaxID=66427 RepID=A0A7W7LL51_9ACTN|nr:hypothetical protein [Streptomyces olivoverticillatus]MBB4892268.1 hypothetical protein [Streptomyces olivoverticillatus]
MRRHALPRTLFAFAVLSGTQVLAGCQAEGPGVQTVVQGDAAVPSAPAGRKGTFLGRGACAGQDGGRAFREVDCASLQAAAGVLARYYGPQSGGPRCPDETDFVLHITAVDAGTSERDSPPEGYACMRNLRPPHPGDPGRGGGPLTVAGDCVRTERHGVVKEVACDGTGAHAPEYRVEVAARTRDDCPPDTDLYVQLGGEAPVGCARRLP